MPRAKKYLEIDCLTAARQRIRHIYEAFDSIAIMFSGGKDSLSCVHLAKEVHDEYDLGPVNVIFRDEEVINPTVLNFVNEYRHKDWVNLAWYCLPNANSRFILGRKLRYIEWDPNREWIRPMPEWAISAKDLGIDGTTSQHSLDDLMAQPFGGKVAFITGVRAAESLIRFRSVTQKLNENYIGSIEGNPKSRVKLCKPIYDWQQNDCLKYLFDNEIAWCPLYDAQEMAGIGLRVSTPLHAVAAKKFDAVRAVEPEFYEQIIRIFPEMKLQERYWKEFDQKALIAAYVDEDPDSYQGVLRYIQDHFESEISKQRALGSVELWRGRRERDPENYPIKLLLETIAFGSTKRRLAGVYTNSKAEVAKRARKDKR